METVITVSIATISLTLGHNTLACAIKDLQEQIVPLEQVSFCLLFHERKNYVIKSIVNSTEGFKSTGSLPHPFFRSLIVCLFVCFLIHKSCCINVLRLEWNWLKFFCVGIYHGVNVTLKFQHSPTSIGVPSANLICEKT